MNNLIKSVLEWSYERNIINGSNYKSQYIKAQSEAGELALALLNEETEEIKDAVGDVLVCLINLSEQCAVNLKFPVCRYTPKTNVFELYTQLQADMGNLADALLKADKEVTEDALKYILHILLLIASVYHYTLEECLESAYNSIKDRKGVMWNEVFIKESDPNYERIVAHIKGNEINEEI